MPASARPRRVVAFILLAVLLRVDNQLTAHRVGSWDHLLSRPSYQLKSSERASAFQRSLATPDADGLNVETVAGTGQPDVGDGKAATEAILELPDGVLAAPDGSFYIVDTFNNRIRHVTGDGIITTTAGTGSGESQVPGDGLPATQAQLRLPRSMKFAPDGSLYIVDTNHYRIRRIGADGVIQTVAGGGGSSVNPPDDVPALGAQFYAAMDIAFDNDGNYYIADSEANRIRRVGKDGFIRTAAGTGAPGRSGDGGPALQAQVGAPQSIASDGRGGLIIACRDGGPLRRLDLASGIITSIDNARGVFVGTDSSANIFFVSYSGGHQLFRRDASSGIIALVAGRSGPGGFTGDGGQATDATLSGPRRLSVDASGAILVADSSNDRIRRVGTDGRITTVAGSGRIPPDGLQANQTAIYDSNGIALDPRGNIFFTDFLHLTIRKIDERGIVSTVAGNRRSGNLNDDVPPLDAFLGTPLGSVFDRNGNLLFIDANNSVGVVRLITTGADGVIDGSPDERVIRIAGQFRPRDEADHGRADGGPARSAVFVSIRSLTLDSQGNLYVGDNLDHRVRKIVPGSDGVFNGGADEIITTVAGNGSSGPSGDGGPATAASLFNPGQFGLAFDAEDNLYIIENNLRIRRVDRATGNIETIWAPDGRRVWSLAFDRSNVLYVAGVTKIYLFDTGTRTMQTIAGSDEAGFGGDGGPAATARMRGAQFLAIDAKGDIYFPDNGNFRIRRLTRPDSDGDGLPDVWEAKYGLSPSSAVGDDGATGDPDKDGVTNLQERQQGTDPTLANVLNLAEGATGFFNELIAITNPAADAAAFTVSFITESGSPITQSYTLAGMARMTINVNDISGLADQAVSAVVNVTRGGVVAERRMMWNARDASFYGGHLGKAITRPRTTWYLAEGEANFFDTYILLANGGPSDAVATLTYLLEDGSPIVRQYPVGAGRRVTIYANDVPGLKGNAFSTTISSTQPIAVERAMYFGTTTSRLWNGGHEAAAVEGPATSWFVAEGRTGPFFDEYLLLANPGSSPANVAIRYLKPGGVVVTQNVTLRPTSRTTIHVDDIAGLADTDVSASITSDQGIIVERAMYWPDPFTNWYEAHASAGLTAAGTKWAIADGEIGGPLGFQTYILLANATSTDATVDLVFLRTSGAAVTLTRTVTANSRLTVSAEEAGLASGERFGVLVQSTNGTSIAVEHALYWNGGGPFWAGGGNETGVRIR